MNRACWVSICLESLSIPRNTMWMSYVSDWLSVVRWYIQWRDFARTHFQVAVLMIASLQMGLITQATNKQSFLLLPLVLISDSKMDQEEFMLQGSMQASDSSIAACTVHWFHMHVCLFPKKCMNWPPVPRQLLTASLIIPNKNNKSQIHTWCQCDFRLQSMYFAFDVQLLSAPLFLSSTTVLHTASRQVI